MSRVTSGLGSVVEAAFLQLLDEAFSDSGIVEGTRGEAIASIDYLIASNLNEVDSLSVTRFETNGGSGSNIQSVA
jgi:hypothetical protein